VLLTQYSDASLRALIPWEVLVVLLVVTVASFRTWRVLATEQALRDSQATAMAALRQSDAVKSALLSSVSHDLRTPLTAIKTMVFGLQQPSATTPGPVQQEFLKNIDGQVDYLNRLVGNLLDMSRLEAGMLKPRCEWHVLEELVEGAIRRVEVLLEGRPLHVHLPPDLPAMYVDGVQVQQVLVNLLDNAIKFSPADSPIGITASRRETAMEVSVSNRGQGVPVDQLERIFDRFYRVQSGHPSSAQGTGLGLAICKGIIEAHAGQIEAHSVPGVDTTIRFRLPLTAPVHDGAEPEPAVQEA
jgi:two-component system, OmpR family, sensor histidine kinase KdpD